MDKYECGPCGYVYDPEAGDPEYGIEPGTTFEDLPDDWTCPISGVEKDMFEKLVRLMPDKVSKSDRVQEKTNGQLWIEG